MLANNKELTHNEKKLIKRLLAKSLTSKKEQSKKSGQYTYVTVPTDRTATHFEAMRYSEADCLGEGSAADVFKAVEIDSNMQILTIPKKHNPQGDERKTKMFAFKKFHTGHGGSATAKEATITREFYETKNAFSPFWFHSCLVTELQKGVGFQPHRNVLNKLKECPLSARIKGAIDLFFYFHKMHNITPNRDYVIIHGDVHGGNILFHVGKNHKIRLRPIDFSASEGVPHPSSMVKTYNANCISPPESSAGEGIVSEISYANENYMCTASDIYGLSYVLHLLFADPTTLPGEDLAHINGPIIDISIISGCDITEHIYAFINRMRCESPSLRPDTGLCLRFLNTILALVEIQDNAHLEEDNQIEKTGLMAKLTLITSGDSYCINQLPNIDFTAPEQHENCQRIIDSYNANHINTKTLYKITQGTSNKNSNIAELQHIVQQMLTVTNDTTATTSTTTTTTTSSHN